MNIIQTLKIISVCLALFVVLAFVVSEYLPFVMSAFRAIGKHSKSTTSVLVACAAWCMLNGSDKVVPIVSRPVAARSVRLVARPVTNEGLSEMYIAARLAAMRAAAETNALQSATNETSSVR